MVTKTGEVLKTSEKQQDMVLNAELLRQIVLQRKSEYEDLQHKIVLVQTKLRALEESQKRQEADFNRKMSIDKQKFEDNKNKKTGEFIEREDKLQKGERNHNEREIRIKEAEVNMAKVEQERKSLYLARVEVEKLNNAAQIEYKKALDLKNNCQKIVDEANKKEQKASQDLSQAQQLNSTALNNIEKFKIKEKDIQSQLENLEKIRKEVQPKIDEYVDLEKKNSLTLQQIEATRAEIDAKIIQDKNFLKELNEKSIILKSKELELATLADELQRREWALQSKDKK